MSVDITVQELLDSKGTQVFSTTPDAKVIDALRILSEAKIGALLVLEDGKLVGIFSERDYARKIILEGKQSKDTQIREVMTTEVQCVSAEKTVKQCMALMTKNHFRHLPVLRDGEVVGMISIGDIVRAILMSAL
ncbi:MAG TPA: CBS domain-containing protein [Thermoguttaceae bacterium]|nr:CBS domain-containing protein [Thermoguttaceae bacterium]